MATTETTNEDVSLKDAVASAVESVTKEQDTSEEVKPEAKKTDTNTEETKKEGASEEDKLEAEEALKLFRALKNPETRGAVIEFMAQNAGYEKKGAIQTKEDVKEAKDDLIGALKESLGSEFEFLADKLAPGLEKYLNKVLKQSQEDIRATLETAEREKLQGQAERSLNKLTEDFFGEGEKIPSEVEKEMSKFMDKFPPSADLTMKEYVTDAFDFAIAKLKLTKVDKKKQEKISNNRSDVASRLASDRTSRTASAVPDTSKSMSRKEAIQAAIEAASKDMKD